MKIGYLIVAIIVSLSWCIIGNTIYTYKISKYLTKKYDLYLLWKLVVDMLCRVIIYILTNLLLKIVPYICAILDFYGIIKFE